MMEVNEPSKENISSDISIFKFKYGITEEEYLNLKGSNVIAGLLKLQAEKNLERIKLEKERMNIIVEVYKTLPSELKSLWLKNAKVSTSSFAELQKDIFKLVAEGIKTENK